MDLHTPLSQSYKEVLSPGISPQSKVGQKSWIQVPYQFPGCIDSAACWRHNRARHTSHRHSFWQYYFTAAVLGSDCYLCALAPWVHIQQICVVVVYPPQTPLLLPWLSFCSFLHLFLFRKWPSFLFVAKSSPQLCLSLLDYGTIKKVLSPLNQSTGSCLLEEIELFPPRKRQHIRSLLILHSRSELYVGVRDQVIKIPLKRCSYHKSREWVHAQRNQQTNTVNLSWNGQKSKCAYNEILKLPLSRDALYLREPGLCVDQGPLVRLKIL